MDVHRIRSLIDLVRGDYEQCEVSQRFSEMMNALQAYANGPSSETAKEYSSQFDALRKALAKSRVHELLPLQRRMLAEIGGTRFMGEGLIAEIERAQDKATTPADIHTAVQELHGKFNQFLKSINQLSTQFDTLGIAPYRTKEGEEEISIILPDQLTKRELGEVELLLHKWGIAVGQIQELVTGRGTPVKVAALEEGSIIIVLATVYSAAYATLKLVNSCLDAYERILKIRMKHRELKDLKVSKDTLESLAKDEKTQTDASVEEIAKAIVTEFGSEDHGGRTPDERLTQTRQTVQFVLRQIDQGVEIEILLLPPPEASADEEQAKGQATKQSVTKELKLSSSSWRTLPREDAPVLELPEPDLDGASPSGAADRDAPSHAKKAAAKKSEPKVEAT